MRANLERIDKACERRPAPAVARVWRPVLLILLAGLAWAPQLAQAGQPVELPWPQSRQTLQYHSCGCADACWVAEVRQTGRENAPLARLRCDCEQLYSRVGRAPERQAAPSCQAFEGPDKFTRIPQTLAELVAAP